MLRMDVPADKIKPGECVWCRIDSPEPGGYSVSVVSNGLVGFLPSYHPIELGRIVPSTFVCMDGERALFTFAFTMGTSARVQHSTASDQENAFSVWADAYPKSLSVRRAVDLVMPPINSAPIMLKLNAQRAKEIFPSLEETNFTGCMKVFCEGKLSRAALIFVNGRAVGSLYTTKQFPDPYPFEAGMRKMMQDVASPDSEADVEMYELPEGIVLSMSSLFLGYVDQPGDKVENKSYTERMLEHFSSRSETGCFSFVDENHAPIALGFVRSGHFSGAYSIIERVFSEDISFWFKLLEANPNCKVLAYILPPAMMTEAIRFGYSLNSEQFAV